MLSDWVFVSCILPLPKGSEDYAISLVVPTATPGLRIYPRRSYASGNAGGFDYPLSSRFDETDSLMVFDDVFVPWENVFVYRDIDITAAQFHKTAAHSIGNTQAQIASPSRPASTPAWPARSWTAAAERATSRTSSGSASTPARPTAVLLRARRRSELVHRRHGRRPSRPGDPVLGDEPAAQLMNDLIFAMRDLAGGSVIQLPSSFGAYDDPVAAADIDRYIRWPAASSDERVKLLKLVWDAIGSEFAGRHMQYEMFYAGEPGVVAMRSFNNYPWAAATDLVDRCMAGVVPTRIPPPPTSADASDPPPPSATDLPPTPEPPVPFSFDKPELEFFDPTTDPRYSWTPLHGDKTGQLSEMILSGAHEQGWVTRLLKFEPAPTPRPTAR